MVQEEGGGIGGDILNEAKKLMSHRRESLCVTLFFKFELSQAKELNMGTWTAVAPVKRVSVTHAGGSSSLDPDVVGVVNKTDVHVTEAGQLIQP